MIVYLLLVPATDVDSECQSNSIELTGCIQTAVRFVTKLGRSRLGSPPLTTLHDVQFSSPYLLAALASFRGKSSPSHCTLTSTKASSTAWQSRLWLAGWQQLIFIVEPVDNHPLNMLTSHLDEMLGLAGAQRLLQEGAVGLTVATALLLAIGGIALDYVRMLWLRSKMVQCNPDVLEVSILTHDPLTSVTAPWTAAISHRRKHIHAA